jgi:hypothetical protein
MRKYRVFFSVSKTVKAGSINEAKFVARVALEKGKRGLMKWEGTDELWEDRHNIFEDKVRNRRRAK